ncbi:hypothetical protein ACOCJ7_03780 [Knoellia sp. CPCC 206453]|uniref:hypothetical protein n=1 Tax=Knoellia pratensis TaxID=3404796 RepID=UPI00360896B3
MCQLFRTSGHRLLGALALAAVLTGMTVTTAAADPIVQIVDPGLSTHGFDWNG